MWQFNIPSEVIDAYSHLSSPKSINPIEKGLINKTFLVDTDNGRYILQEVSPIFDEGIHFDSVAICQYLTCFNIATPAIRMNRFGDLFFNHQGRIFRALTYVRGESFHQINSLPMAEEAGRVVGQFHKSLVDFSYQYRSQRRHKGDYPFHVENLKAALKSHEDHDFYVQVKPLAEKMIEQMAALSLGLHTTPRHAHGDPKISNILFDGDQAVCLIDFDTLGYSGWSLEMGDALRSWANPHQEDVLDAVVDLRIAENALSGYGREIHGLFSVAEKAELVSHTQAVSLCLAIRYLTDVLNENYFGFARDRFSRAADHHWLRAQAMFNLCQEFSRNKKILLEMAECLI